MSELTRAFLYKRLGQLLEFRQMTEQDFCNLIGSHPYYVRDWISGDKIPYYKTIKRLSKALDCDSQWLEFGIGDPPRGMPGVKVKLVTADEMESRRIGRDWNFARPDKEKAGPRTPPKDKGSFIGRIDDGVSDMLSAVDSLAAASSEVSTAMASALPVGVVASARAPRFVHLTGSGPDLVALDSKGGVWGVVNFQHGRFDGWEELPGHPQAKGGK